MKTIKQILTISIFTVSLQVFSNVLYGQEFAPIFPGGEKELFCFINKNINLEKLKSIDTVGQAFASFIIDTTGEIKDIKIIKSLNPIVDKELLRIISLMPKWTPGKQSDKLVPVSISLPLRIPYENKFCR